MARYAFEDLTSYDDAFEDLTSPTLRQVAVGKDLHVALLTPKIPGQDEDDGEEADGPEYIVIDDDNASDRARSAEQEERFPVTVELPSIQLDCGMVKSRDIVELFDRTERVADQALSGDFLWISAIIEDLETNEITLQGYRLRRCSYLRPLFDCKMNELFILVEAYENDPRPPMVQGLESIPITEVFKKRKCEFTNADYEAYNVLMANRWVPAGLKTLTQIKHWIFNQGTLICRFVHIVILDHNGVSYSGEVRKLHRREVDKYSTPCPYRATPPVPASRRTTSFNSSSSSSSQRNIKRRPSVEQLDGTPPKRLSPLAKMTRYTFGDAYCGVGGASEGASQAGLFVKWGLDKDKLAIEAYAENFSTAEHLWMDARDFRAIANRCEHSVDVLHLSCPCCYWSEAHTHGGKNDQENMETLLTVGPFLMAVKPRYATLEQAPGLLKQQKHRKWFRWLLNGITSAKYNVRWKVSDQSEYGLPQRRRRLVFLCAKQGLPLPAFPKPVHGPKGSGLRHWVTVGDALESLNRQGPAARDPYHRPEQEKVLSRPAVDPRTILAKCITTSGGENVHPSGTRRYTPREIAGLQGFPPDYHFSGTRSDATKQAGNAWGPIANQKYFLLSVQFLEAYDLGFIDPEDEIDDLHEYLEDRNIRVPSGTRYLKHLTKSVSSKKKHPLWGSTYKVEPAPRGRTIRDVPVIKTREQRRVRDAAEVARQTGDLIELD
ncbi:hypothetical protein N0V90_005434 [Kalmusia sp. IMI 367209]|nr:hypothetical protein N0V90_005434 [Kalmusia sp. IMI 367209]